MADFGPCDHPTERRSPSQTAAAWCNACGQVVAIPITESYFVDGRVHIAGKAYILDVTAVAHLLRAMEVLGIDIERFIDRPSTSFVLGP